MEILASQRCLAAFSQLDQVTVTSPAITSGSIIGSLPALQLESGKLRCTFLLLVSQMSNPRPPGTSYPRMAPIGYRSSLCTPASLKTSAIATPAMRQMSRQVRYGQFDRRAIWPWLALRYLSPLFYQSLIGQCFKEAGTYIYLL